MRRRHTANADMDRVSVASDYDFSEKSSLVRRRRVTVAAPTGGWYHRMTHENNKQKMPLTKRLHGLAKQETLHAHCHSMRAGKSYLVSFEIILLLMFHFVTMSQK